VPSPRRDQLSVADITDVPTHAGFLYLAVVLDAWSRRVVGWSMASNPLRRHSALNYESPIEFEKKGVATKRS